jgi:hypothetical protein
MAGRIATGEFEDTADACPWLVRLPGGGGG